MKIAIEAQRIFRPKKHGMDFVALEMIRELQKIDTVNEYRIYIKPDSDKCLTETPNFKIIELPSFGGYPMWEQWALPRAVNQWNPDILHCTSNTAPLFVNAKLVITLHDIIFLEKGHEEGAKNKSLYQKFGKYYRKLVVPPVLKKAAKIITVSKFEQKRITEALHLPAEKLTAVYNGYSSHFIHREFDQAVSRKYNLPARYFFFLGNTDPKKNTQRVLQAYYSYVNQTPNPAFLVIADLKEEFISDFEVWKDEEFRKKIVFLGYVSNLDLPAIYSMADIFLYPSLRESFGIPILESMACEVPIITGNTSAMPEIAGEGALLIDPFNEADILQKILDLENDPALAQKQRAYGLERVKLFSWRKTAEDVLKIYQSLVK
ncbi:MAG: glycosyltransferase family 1 protein [Bacteroidales bacterium]|nr:glycosyltransferase family 1 protein [Bacteroidales bacterium]